MSGCAGSDLCYSATEKWWPNAVRAVGQVVNPGPVLAHPIRPGIPVCCQPYRLYGSGTRLSSSALQRITVGAMFQTMPTMPQQKRYDDPMLP